jgi:hypothetical protein
VSCILFHCCDTDGCCSNKASTTSPNIHILRCCSCWLRLYLLSPSPLTAPHITSQASRQPPPGSVWSGQEEAVEVRGFVENIIFVWF